MADSDDPRVPALTKAATDAGIVSNHGISLNLPESATNGRPAAVKHMSLPVYQSPLRHHRRSPSRTGHVKETLNARSHYSSSDDDGGAVHRINQYIIKQEIGRGSFGAVHLATDQYGTEYAVKEFSKSRLRKRAQSNLLRRPPTRRQSGHLATKMGFNSPLHRVSPTGNTDQKDNSLDLIKEEIAIMKKLDHNNVVSLIEVLDDPQEDSLYMVLEMCKKGVVMNVGLDERADPYEDETCRYWFRDMVLGIEYLHAQGIIHRDIKPDNCLITQDDVLKIVDFGVSEMFEKESDMSTAKSAGSPAFMPPELCVARHGQVSGRAADIWSMGVTLYCLRYGRIPFEKHTMLELYEAIRNDDVDLSGEKDSAFEDLMRKMLEKDPDRRITIETIRDHPWVTKHGSDPLLSAEENCSNLVDLPTKAELEQAITGNMKSLLVVMKAVKKFKDLLFKKRPETMEGVFGRSPRLVAPPGSYHSAGGHRQRQAKSTDGNNRVPFERFLATQGIHHDIDVADDNSCHPRGIAAPPGHSPTTSRHVATSTGEEQPSDEKPATSDSLLAETRVNRTPTLTLEDHTKGHAHDPLTDVLFLNIGAGLGESPPDQEAKQVLSESPGATEMNVYESAYEEEMQRILSRRGREPTIYLTRRVEGNHSIRNHESVIRQDSEAEGSAGGGLASLLRKASEQQGLERGETKDGVKKAVSRGGKVATGAPGGLASLVKKAKEREDAEAEGTHDEQG